MFSGWVLQSPFKFKHVVLRISSCWSNLPKPHCNKDVTPFDVAVALSTQKSAGALTTYQMYTWSQHRTTSTSNASAIDGAWAPDNFHNKLPSHQNNCQNLQEHHHPCSTKHHIHLLNDPNQNTTSKMWARDREGGGGGSGAGRWG